MKKLKILLSSTAFVLAIGAAFASQLYISSNLATPGYKQVGTECEEVQDCNGGNFVCKSQGDDLFEKVGTSCDTPLRHDQ